MDASGGRGRRREERDRTDERDRRDRADRGDRDRGDRGERGRRRSQSRPLRSRSPRARRRQVSRSRSRSCSEYQRKREASREASRERRRERAKQERDERARERAENEPSQTVLVQDIPDQGVTEERLEAVAWELAVQAGSSMPESARFAYDPETQQFKGFATIEFPHKEAAKAFKEHASGTLDVDDCKLTLRYHHSETELSRSPERFDRRGNDDPSVTIIVKGLSSVTAESTIIAAFHPFATIKDIRHFPRRGFAFIQFHSCQESAQALRGFEKELGGKIDGHRIVANFAKEQKQDLRGFTGAERDFLAKQAIASAEANAQMESIAKQQQVEQVTEKALSGVNGGMWASYMQSCTQTATVQSTNTFSFDKESGFYKDAKAGLFYDPNTTYFFTTDFKKYFVYNHEVQMLCHVDKEGKQIEGGERIPMPSAGGSADSRPRRARSKTRSRSRRRARSRSRGPTTPASAPTPARTDHQKLVEQMRQQEKADQQRREQMSSPGLRRSRSRGPASSSRGAAVNPALATAQKFGLVGRPNREGPPESTFMQGMEKKNADFKPIHFPGGDPLARFAPAADATPKPEAKKKRRPQAENILGLASTPVASLAAPGRITVLSATDRLMAGRPSTVQIAAATEPSPFMVEPPRRSPVTTPAVPPALSLEPGEAICEVCMRKFSSEEMLRKHERLSDLHKQNLAKLHGDV